MSRILLVGDRALARRSAGEFDGSCIVHVRTLLDALREAGSSAFDLALVEADLPDGSGLDILGFLQLRRVRVVILTRETGETLTLRALRLGAREVLRMDAHLGPELGRCVRALERADEAPLVALAPGGARPGERPAGPA